MKKRVSTFAMLAMIFILVGFRGTTTKIVRVPETLEVLEPTPALFPQNKAILHTPTVFPPFVGSTYIGFKEALGFKESSGNYFAINSFGYLGKYQFGVSTLEMVGVYDPSHFLNDPALQERAFYTNLVRNKWILRREIKRFKGRFIKGVKISESGILAAAHLSGAGNVKRYLHSYGKNDKLDAYGTSITDYLRKFSGYDVSSVVLAKRNPKV